MDAKPIDAQPTDAQPIGTQQVGGEQMDVAGEPRAGAEEPLAGGNMGPVSRRGDEVLRPAGPWTPQVHRLLEVYAAAGVEGTPRPLGYTTDGRERLSHLPGTVPNYPLPDWVWAGPVLVDAARLLRRLHDASVGLAEVRGALQPPPKRASAPGTSGASAILGGVWGREGWRSPVREPAEVVCHNDFAVYNLVFSDEHRLTGVIDFDYCSPGPRLWDLAYLAYTLVPLSGALGPAPFDASERLARIRVLLTAYGSDASAGDLVATAVERLRDLADFSDRAAVELANPDLHRHATGYRTDAVRLASGRLTP